MTRLSISSNLPATQVDLDLILALRLAVARFGEMDRFKWWNTNGMLGQIGELVASRGFPKTQSFARARVVFAVASNRSDEIFNPPDSYTLWRLPSEIEERVDERWADSLDTPEPWMDLLSRIDSEMVDGRELLDALSNLKLISQETSEYVKRLRRSDDNRSVHIKQPGKTAGNAIEILAAAFNCGEQGKLAVPFIRHGDFPA